MPAPFIHRLDGKTVTAVPADARADAELQADNVMGAASVGGFSPKLRTVPPFFKEGHGDGAENCLICFARKGICMILLTHSDNGELAFRPLLEKLIGDTVTPWVWESYTRKAIMQNEEHTGAK